MSGWLTGLGPAGTGLALLVLGHVCGDFLFQTDAMARSKHRTHVLLLHVGIVLVAHAIALAPLLTRQTALLIAAIGGSHLLIDAVTSRLRPREATSAPLFLADQAAHLLVILGGWAVLAPTAWTLTPVVSAAAGSDQLPWAEVTTGAVYLAAFVFAADGGNAIVRGVLPEEEPATAEPDAASSTAAEADLGVGSRIGALERWIILLVGVAGLWEAIAVVTAAKSIARFEALKRRPFAEYFLVGTLTSVLVAIGLVAAVGVLV